MHAEEAVEGPFPVELHDGREEGWIAREACFGYDVLAGVVAFLGAGPEEEAVLEGYAESIFTTVGFFAVFGTRSEFR